MGEPVETRDEAPPPDLAEGGGPTHPSRSALRESFAIVAVGLAAVAALVWWATSPAGSRTSGRRAIAIVDPRIGEFVGSQSCRECHPGETALHARSGHARTLRPIAARPKLLAWLDGRTEPDPEKPGVRWRFTKVGDGLEIERDQGGERRRFPVDFAFGSGHHATTFVTLTDRDPRKPRGLEHRLTYYSNPDRLDLTPGHSAAEGPGPEMTADGHVLGPGEALRCFGCHATATSTREAATLDPASMIADVTCERCHGPARKHVAAARAGREGKALAMAFGPDSWTADEQMKLCGDCHRHPSNLRADIPIEPENREIVRFQPVGLMASRCYQESRGALSCVNCHDPHARSETRAEVYEAACLSCHTSPAGRACPVSPRTDCIGCHMPKRDSGQKILFTDHWIRVRSRDDKSDQTGPQAAPARKTVDPAGTTSAGASSSR